MRAFIDRLPKAELHVHIEGTLEPALMMELAASNDIKLPYADVDEVHAAYQFSDLQSFLDIYYQGAAVLRTEEDFYRLTSAYLDRAHDDGVRHAEIFFDPQTHTQRGVGFPVFMAGFRQAMRDGEQKHGITSSLIMSFLRHLSGEAAVATLQAAEPHLEGVVAVGLDSSELGRPPELFIEAFDMARQLGLLTVAHAGEEGPPEYIWSALDNLGVHRIDHGNRSLEDPNLVARLRRERVPLTVCPLSNVALKVVDRIEDHTVPHMHRAGLHVSLHSDDPPYFGGYVGDNYEAVARAFHWRPETLASLARTSITSSFLEKSRQQELLREIDTVENNYHATISSHRRNVVR